MGHFPYRFGEMEDGFWGAGRGDAGESPHSSKMVGVAAEPSGVLLLPLWDTMLSTLHAASQVILTNSHEISTAAPDYTEEGRLS